MSHMCVGDALSLNKRDALMNPYVTTPLSVKSKQFASDALSYTEWMRNERKEFILSNQIKRAAVSVGACVAESTNAESPKDMLHKLGIATKEARECSFHLSILHSTGLEHPKLYAPLMDLLNEVTALLVTSTHTLRSRLPKRKTKPKPKPESESESEQ